MKITLTLPPSLAARVQRQAEQRGTSVEAFLLTMADWHSPAYDNDAQYLKARIRAALATADFAADAVTAVARLAE